MSKRAIRLLGSALACVFLLLNFSVAKGSTDAAFLGEAKKLKLYFIHLSCGENWLADWSGGLRRAINNAVTPAGYKFKTYDSHTGNSSHLEWFDRFTYDNDWQAFDIVMFKSCYPASHIDSKKLLRQYKKMYRKQLMKIFKAHPDILFIIVTAPPLVPNETDQASADRARTFNNWLKKNFLKKYNKKNPGLNNVAVFDFFNVLANDSDPDCNMLKQEYRQGAWDSHPNPKGNKQATEEFISFLKPVVDNWKAKSIL